MQSETLCDRVGEDAGTWRGRRWTSERGGHGEACRLPEVPGGQWRDQGRGTTYEIMAEN